MFRRKNKPALMKRILSFLWPESGWKRYGQYILLRLQRLKGTPKEISAGVACGVAISFTPFVGFHFVLAAISAWLVNGNILASAIGTAAGNPWTFPFIWVSILYTGRHILGSHMEENNVAFIAVFEKASRSLMTFDFKLFAAEVWPILWPMIVGCVPFYFVAWFITYFLMKNTLEKLDARRQRKRKVI